MVPFGIEVRPAADQGAPHRAVVRREREPSTPSHPFAAGKEDPAFRTKLKIASQLVEQCVQEGIPFRAVVADSFYGEDEGFKQSLSEGIDRERELRAVVLAALLSRPESQT